MGRHRLLEGELVVIETDDSQAAEALAAEAARLGALTKIERPIRST
jgi:hypothetical protein